MINRPKTNVKSLNHKTHMIVIYLIKDTSMLRSLILVTSIRSVNCYIPLIITFGNYHLSQSAETHTLFSTLPSTIQLENNVKRDQADNQVRSCHFINEKINPKSSTKKFGSRRCSCSYFFRMPPLCVTVSVEVPKQEPEIPEVPPTV